VSKDKIMKKAVYIIVAISAFMLGASVYYVSSLFVPVSLSELRKNISHYKHIKIKVAAKLEVTEENSRYYINLKDWENDCSGDNFCFQSLEFSEEVLAQNISLIKELVEKNKTVERTTLIKDSYWADGEYYVDAEVTGRIVEKENKLFGGTFYAVKVERIKQNSPIKFVPVRQMLGR
jgi:hypothetical protein